MVSRYVLRGIHSNYPRFLLVQLSISLRDARIGWRYSLLRIIDNVQARDIDWHS